MHRLAIALLSLLLVVEAAQGAARKGTRFWNLTSSTVTRLQLAPAGTQSFGPTSAKTIPTARSIMTSACGSWGSRRGAMTSSSRTRPAAFAWCATSPSRTTRCSRSPTRI